MELRKGYKMTDFGLIPEDWEVLRLGEHLDFKNGLNKSSEYFGYGTPIINYMDVYRKVGITSVNGMVFLSQNELKNFSAKIGDVFFTRTSETQQEIGFSSVLMSEIKHCVFSGFVLRGRPKNNRISKEFFQYCLLPEYVRIQIISKSSYTTRALTSGKSLSSVRIVAPCLPEQTAISTSLSDIDALIAQTEKLIEKNKVIKQSLIQRLLSPNDSEGNARQGWKKKRLGELFLISAGGDFDNGSFSPNYDAIYSYPIYSNAHTQNGLYGFSSVYSSTENSITVTARGEVGYAIPRYSKYKAIGRLLVLNPIAELDCYFVAEYINNFISFANESTGVPQLTAPQISNYEIRLPSFEEQVNITLILKDFDSMISTLIKKLRKASHIKQGMLQNLLSGNIRIYKPQHESTATI